MGICFHARVHCILRPAGMSADKYQYNACPRSQSWYQIFSCTCAEEDNALKECLPFVATGIAILKFSH